MLRQGWFALLLILAVGACGRPAPSEDPARTRGETAEDANDSPIAKIKQACDDKPQTYWQAQPGAEPDMTITVANTCKCEMTVDVRAKNKQGFEYGLKLRKISPGKSESIPVKKAMELLISCATGDGDCTGTYQFAS
jgi:hypothetical protein